MFMKECSFVVGIDASNISGGGGLKHLVEVLKASMPEKSGVSSVIVWCLPSTVQHFPVKEWLTLVPVSWFEKSLLHRQLWRSHKLKKEINSRCDVLFVPGGIALAVGVPDVVMSQNMQPFIASERAAAGYGRPRVRVELLRFLQGWSFQKAKGRLFLTDFAAGSIKDQFPFPSTNNAIIPHGVDPAFFYDFSERRHEISGEFRISYVSTLNTYKHQLEVIEAVLILSVKYPSVKLNLYGGEVGGYGNKVRKRIDEVNDAAGKELISYIGPVPFESLPEIYRDTDINLFASSCENLPNILLEAMASSSPIVCSEYEPMPSILKNAGLYCDVKSPESIAKSIEAYIASPELRREKGQRANLLATEYSWDETAKRTFDFLAQVADMHG